MIMTNILKRWFFMIQEPRVVRLMLLGFYLSVIGTGLSGFLAAPDRFFTATGPAVVFFCSAFLIFGGIAGAVAVLPGLWWLEKTGIVSIAFGIALRGVLVSALAVSTMGALFLLTEFILIAVRYVSIRRADLAPIAG